MFAQRMKSQELFSPTDVMDAFEYENGEQEIALPTLPIKTFLDKTEFEKRVQSLRKEYETNKPVGNFF